MARPSAPSPEGGPGFTPARHAAFEVLRRTFEGGAWADRALRSAAERHGLEGRDRAFAQRLAYGAVQRRGTADHFIEHLAGRPISKLDPPALAALRLGLYELLFEPGSAAHAAVSEAVELAKGPGSRRQAAARLVNAVLRRAARERDGLLAGLDDSGPDGAATAHSFPRWLARHLWEELGAEVARAMLRALNEPAERALRVNTLRAGREQLLARLTGAGEALRLAAAADPLLAPPDAVVAAGPWGEPLRDAVAAGDLVPQSRASQAVVAVLDPRAGERVLDLCAGPGIKATAIAARTGDEGEVHAVEANSRRASELEELAGRLEARAIAVEVADAAEADLGAGYDRVLVDPPCTDLGALAARPDARWRKRAGDAERLAGLQRQILFRAGRALRPGGTLVYSTCTVSRTENEGVVAAALERDAGLAADDLGADHPGLASTHDSRFLQTRPDRDATTGFFIARLRRAGS